MSPILTVPPPAFHPAPSTATGVAARSSLLAQPLSASALTAARTVHRTVELRTCISCFSTPDGRFRYAERRYVEPRNRSPLRQGSGPSLIRRSATGRRPGGRRAAAG